jgi:glucose-6-phosphate isomerase
MNPKFSKTWAKLQNLSEDVALKDLQLMFVNNPVRSKELSFEMGDIFIDFSKNWVNEEVVSGLVQLVQEAGLKDKINALFAGKRINTSENKPATHTAQRKAQASAQILADRNKMFSIANNYTSGNWRTAFGHKVCYVVNIGIGGSYLGPKLAIQALTELQTNNNIKVLFYPSVDDCALKSIMDTIDLTKTLFCISSKSLGTIETITNTNTILHILENMRGYKPSATNRSFVVATTNFDKAADLSIPETHVMPFDNATGGRFSVWSSIGFPVLMAIGEEKFKEFLAGAEKMDEHFYHEKLESNLPVLMGVVSIWYRSFMDLPAYAVIPYDVRLQNMPAWLQQLMMESNGKMVDVDGNRIEMSTAPWVFGGHGQLSQHAFFQAFHQGNDVLPIDFIGVLDKGSESQNFLLINMLAQSSALMNGNDDGDKQSFCPGNRPSTTLLLKTLSASSLGQLLALYEHMIFVQSVLWNINCFDQPGVELGKQIAKQIVQHMNNDSLEQIHLDKSTSQLLARVLKND